MDTRKTLRASPAALVAMHSNRPSCRGLGLAMSSDPEDCRLWAEHAWGSAPAPRAAVRGANPTLRWDLSVGRITSAVGTCRCQVGGVGSGGGHPSPT